MKIEEVNIEKFGKLERKKIEFKNGINLIEGNNESGKSTILQFILSTFFGFYKYKRNGFKEIDLWRPWNDTVFLGSLKYSLDNSKTYNIERNFNEKNPTIYDGNFKDITSRYLRNKTNVEILEEQIGVDEDIFKNAVIAKQNLMILEDEDKNSLIHKIINQTTSGNENISLNLINKKLNTKLRDEIGTNLTKAKPINIIDGKLLKLYEQKQELEYIENQKSKTEKDRKTVQERFSSSSEKLELIKKIKDVRQEFIGEQEVIDALKNNLEEKYKKQIETETRLKAEYKESVEKIRKRTIEEERVGQLEEIERRKQLDTADEESIKESDRKRNKSFKYILSFVVFALLITILNLLFKNLRFKGLSTQEYFEKVKTMADLKYSNIGIIVSYIISNIVNIIIDITAKRKSDNNKLKSYSEELENFDDDKENLEKDLNINEDYVFDEEEKQFIESQIKFLNKELENDKQNIIRREELLKQKEKEISFVILKEFSSKVDSKYIKSILEMPDNKLKTEEGMLKQIYETAMYSLSQLEAQKNELNKKQNMSLEIEEQISKLEEEKNELIELRDVINIAQNILEESNEELKQIIDPNFMNMFNKIIMKITDGKYTNVNIKDETDIFAKDNIANKVVDIKTLSSGTIDQFNLAFRLTVLMNVSEEKLPIIFDEAFVNYDNNRLTNILKYFEKISKERQIILFSSNDRERRILEKANIRYHYIEME